MKYLISIMIALISITVIQASEPLPIASPDLDTLLNEDFGDHMGQIVTRDMDNNTGIFIYSPETETYLLRMQEIELQHLLEEYLPGRLIASDETGANTLYDLGDGRYQMRLTTPNGPIDFTYRGNTPGSVQAANDIPELDENIVLKQSPDETYKILLLTSGKIDIRMGPDTENRVYEVILNHSEDASIEYRVSNANNQESN